MAWERIDKRRKTEQLGRLKLYRDELEAIAEALAEFGDLEIIANGQRGNAPGDFADPEAELPERLDKVEMRATKGESAIEVNLGSGAEVVLTEPDIAARGVLTNIKEICAPCRKRSFAYGLLLVLQALSPLIGSVASSQRFHDPADIILNVPRAERPTFGQRLVADGGVSFFWAAVGLVGGGLIGYLVNQMPGL